MSVVLDALWLGALLPLLFAVALHRTAPPGALLLASAFGVSFVGDFLAGMTGGGWEWFYLWLPAQLWLVLAALPKWREEAFAGAALLLLPMAWDVAVQREGADVLVTLLGSALVVTLALIRQSPFRLSITCYFGVGSAFYLAMVSQMETGAFMVWWWGYQACRVLAWSCFALNLVYWRHASPVKREPFGFLDLMEAT